MDAQPAEEPMPQNETPESVAGAVSAGLAFVQQYGWFLLLAVIAVLYLKKKFVEPRLNQWQQQREDASYKKMDSGKAQEQLEAMERARQRMQEQLDRQATEYKVKQQEKEEKARQERIADWERHLEGRGYRSKYRPKDEGEAEGPSQPKPKPKKPLRDPDYNPLMGNSSGSCFRPPRRGPTGGG